VTLYICAGQVPLQGRLKDVEENGEEKKACDDETEEVVEVEMRLLMMKSFS